MGATNSKGEALCCIEASGFSSLIRQIDRSIGACASIERPPCSSCWRTIMQIINQYREEMK